MKNINDKLLVFIWTRPPPRSTRTYTLCPCTTLFRSKIRIWKMLLEVRMKFEGSGYHDAEHRRYRTRTPFLADLRCNHHASRDRSPRRQERRIRLHARSEEHTYELQSLMRSSYAVFCLKKKTTRNTNAHCCITRT